MNTCMWILLGFCAIVTLVLCVVYLYNLHNRVSRLERRASPRLEIIEREVHGLGFYMRIILGLLILFCLFISIHYLIYGCSQGNCSTDGRFGSADTVITIFGVMITLLIGWQIWQTIMSRREVERAMEAGQRLDELRAELMRTQEIGEGHVWRTEADILFGGGEQGYETFRTYYESLRHYIAGQADLGRHISQVLSHLRATVDNDLGLGGRHWVIIHEREIDAMIDDIGAGLTTLEGDTAQVRSQLARIRASINRIRHNSSPNPTSNERR